jgi:hypothetical protein
MQVDKELYRLLDEGEEAVKQGRKRPLDEVMAVIRDEIAGDAMNVSRRIMEKNREAYKLLAK